MSSGSTQFQWMNRAELPDALPAGCGKRVFDLCDRLMSCVLEESAPDDFLRQQLPEIASELSVQWGAVVQRKPEWSTLAEFGRLPLQTLPFGILGESLDRDAGGFIALDEAAGWSLVTIPLTSNAFPSSLLSLAGQNMSPTEILPASLAVGRTLSFCLDVSERQSRSTRRIERLRSTLQIASSIAGVHESQPLLELLAQEATRLLECDRASIFLWDREHKEIVACPALGVDGGTLRLPDNKGLVGEVIQNGSAARIDEAYEDPRFSRSADEASGYVTKNLLCWPMRDDSDELIGAFEVINKNEGAFTQDDEECLTLLASQAAVAIRNTQEREQLVRSRNQLAEQVMQGVRLVGESPAIAALKSSIERLASTDLPVLILGESGTGKEVVAQSLHYYGQRADQPFVAVNCAALAETLLESELFGHEKGAFTDAGETRQGKFELADGGTLFLDEIGDMSLGGQAKLLRVLEQKNITRVGGSQPISINVRVIAATNSNLAEKVSQKTFREDLYYRLSVVTQNLPALRDRPEDIVPLATHFLEQFCPQAGRPLMKLSPDARKKLQSHHWPGNVRELRNLMERIAFLSSSDRIGVDDLAFIISPERQGMLEPSADMSLNDATLLFQQEFIRRSIKRVQGNMSEAARLLGLHRSNLYRKMRQLEMHEGGGDKNE
jgi:transcriptional regulator with GAF, ATPase, and Fis domain